MYKVEKIRNFLDCDKCNKLLTEPVTTVCGYTICKFHLDQLKDSFQCDLCHREHTVPKDGFEVARRLQDALSIQLNTLELTPVYDECKKVIGEAQKDVAEIESIDKDPENYIYEYFEDIKRQVDLRREDLKEKVDKYSDETIKTINNAQKTCQKLAKEVNKLSKDFEDSKKELNELIRHFDTFKISDEKFQEIKENVSDLKSKFKRMLTTYKSSLINDKDYTFRFEEVQISNVFGKFEEVNLILIFYNFLNKLNAKKLTFIFKKHQIRLDSTILDGSIQCKLVQLCEFSQCQKWKLLYRASRDGFSGGNFHSKCDGMENTLTVIKSESGNVFGGYTDKAWTSGCFEHIRDPNAFIFSLINKEDRPFKVICSNGGHYAIFCHLHACGPAFGRCPGDLFIASDSNTNNESYSNLSITYKHHDYPVRTEKSKNILAGSYKFKTTEIEVYSKMN